MSDLDNVPHRLTDKGLAMLDRFEMLCVQAGYTHRDKNHITDSLWNRVYLEFVGGDTVRVEPYLGDTWALWDDVPGEWVSKHPTKEEADAHLEQVRTWRGVKQEPTARFDRDPPV